MSHIQHFFPTLVVYLKPRLLLILLLGFSSGLPLSLSGATLAVWMKELDVDLATIGLFSLVGLPYTIKFFWAPVVDTITIPFLTKFLGRRRAWLIASQLILIATIVYLGSLNPLEAPWYVALGALIVAATSATQDIVIDAFRIESLSEDEQPVGAAYYVAAYRIAMLVSTAGVIALVAYLQVLGISEKLVWFYGYVAAAGLVFVGIAGTLFAFEPSNSIQHNSDGSNKGSLEGFFQTTQHAFSDFLMKPQVALILIFVVLFKFCDALAGVMTVPFVLDIGFNKVDYAAIVKGVGLAATLAGTFAAGGLAYKFPLYTSLWIAVLIQTLSNLIFVWQAWIGPEHWALVVTIIVENFTGAVGTIIFIAYLSALCTNPLHTATQYAILTALAAVSRTILSSSSGYIAELTGWTIFFVVTTIVAIPALLLLIYLKQAGHFNTLHHNGSNQGRF